MKLVQVSCCYCYYYSFFTLIFILTALPFHCQAPFASALWTNSPSPLCRSCRSNYGRKSWLQARISLSFVDKSLILQRCSPLKAASSSDTSFVHSLSEEELRSLYLTVAEQDPEWFQAFVVNILGEDEVGEDVVAVMMKASSSSSLSSSSSSILPSVTDPFPTTRTGLDMDNRTAVAAAAQEVDIADDAQAEKRDVAPTQARLVKEVARDFDDISATRPIETIVQDDSIGQTNNRTYPGDSLITSTPETNLSSAPENETEEEMIVLYKDLSLSSIRRKPSSWLSVPLSRLIELDYKPAEVVSLQPEALDFIAQEGIQRPRTGIPSRWKLQKINHKGNTVSNPGGGGGEGVDEQDVSDPPVRILLRKDADTFLAKQQQQQQPSRPQKQQYAQQQERFDIDNDEGTISTGKSPSLGKERQEQIVEPSPRSKPRPPRNSAEDRGELQSDEWRKGPPEKSVDEYDKNSERRRLQRKDRLMNNGRPKPIYSGRPTKADKLQKMIMDDDPPSPVSSVWPDIHSFRNMLRSEAAMRLRILGDDWADVVKEESDWRLDMYKQWLWTLHKGVGTPIVESRSDRMRRLSSTTMASSRDVKYNKMVDRSAARKRQPPTRRSREQKQREKSETSQ